MPTYEEIDSDPFKYVSNFDRVHMNEIVLEDYGTNFSAMLFRLIHKADSVNKERLRKAYPEHVEAYERWYYGVK